MSRPISAGGRRCSLLWAAGAATVASGLLAQQPKPERLAFVEISQLAAAASPDRADEPASLPVIVDAEGYSPASARRLLASGPLGSTTTGAIDGKAVLFAAGPGRAGLLLRHIGGVRFRDITSPIGLPSREGILSVAFSDYNRSGRQSLFLAGAAGVKLLRNHGKDRFSDATAEAGLQGAPDQFHAGAALGDLDADGYPDLLLAAYADLTRPPAKARFTFPNDLAGVASRLYRNNRNGTFTDVTEPAGLALNAGRCRKALLADLNNDRRLDILLLRDDKPPALFLNDGGWKFTETTWSAGDALTRHAFFEGAVADFNKDGKLDLVLWSALSFQVLLNRGGAVFDHAKFLPRIPPPLSGFGFRGAIADLDGDGSEDLLTVDRDGRIHALLNNAGAFREVPIALPSGFESGPLGAIQLRDVRGILLAARHSSGRLALMRKSD